MIPEWLHDLSIAYVSLGIVSALIIAVDVLRHPQQMWIMDIVWPVTALFGTAAVLWQYFSYGRQTTCEKSNSSMACAEKPTNKTLAPFPVIVCNGTLHCGAACTLGDICAEWLIFSVPGVATAFGWLFHERLFAEWTVDFLIAYAFGIVFQYFAIAPMRGLSLTDGLIAAVKADTISITLWQIGMYGFMAIAYFIIFGTAFDTRLEVNSFEFWFTMQIAMTVGFLTSYPANWWLITRGFKEHM